MLSITFATAKVLQILHICKRSGIFFEKNATYRVLLGYRTVIGSLLTDNCSIPNKQGPKSHFQKKDPALYIFRKMRTYFRGGTLLFLIVGRTEVQLFLIYANYSLLFVKNGRK